MHLKMSAGKWRPFCLGLNVLTLDYSSLYMNCMGNNFTKNNEIQALWIVDECSFHMHLLPQAVYHMNFMTNLIYCMNRISNIPFFCLRARRWWTFHHSPCKISVNVVCYTCHRGLLITRANWWCTCSWYCHSLKQHPHETLSAQQDRCD